MMLCISNQEKEYMILDRHITGLNRNFRKAGKEVLYPYFRF